MDDLGLNYCSSEYLLIPCFINFIFLVRKRQTSDHTTALFVALLTASPSSTLYESSSTSDTHACPINSGFTIGLVSCYDHVLHNLPQFTESSPTLENKDTYF